MEETRVEKYKAYREEIQNSFTEVDVTPSKKTAERVDEIMKNNNNDTLSVKQMLDVREIYNRSDETVNPLETKNKKIKNYFIISSIIIAVLLGLTIFFAIKAFGGK